MRKRSNDVIDDVIRLFENCAQVMDSELELDLFPITKSQMVIAKELPSIYQKSQNPRFRKIILGLASRYNYKVKYWLFSSLKIFWGNDEDLIYESISKLVIQNNNSTSIDEMQNYLSLLYLLPDNSKLFSEKLKHILSFLLIKTISYYVKNEQNGRFNIWVSHKWNHIFFSCLTHLLMNFPEHFPHEKFVKPIFNKLEVSMDLINSFLAAFTSVGILSNKFDTFFDILSTYAKQVLNSNIISSDAQNSRNILNNCLLNNISTSQLILPPLALTRFSSFIIEYGDKLGHESLHFSYLVRFFTDIGFAMVPQIGIECLCRIISRHNLIAHENFFEQYDITIYLANLLTKSWKHYRNEIIKSHLNNFILLLNITEKNGSILSHNLLNELKSLKINKPK